MKVIEFSYEERTGAQHFYSHHEVAIFQNDSHAAQDDAVEARATEALDMEHVHDCRDTFEACRAAVRHAWPQKVQYFLIKKERALRPMTYVSLLQLLYGPLLSPLQISTISLLSPLIRCGSKAPTTATALLHRTTTTTAVFLRTKWKCSSLTSLKSMTLLPIA